MPGAGLEEPEWSVSAGEGRCARGTVQQLRGAAVLAGRLWASGGLHPWEAPGRPEQGLCGLGQAPPPAPPSPAPADKVSDGLIVPRPRGVAGPGTVAAGSLKRPASHRNGQRNRCGSDPVRAQWVAEPPGAAFNRSDLNLAILHTVEGSTAQHRMGRSKGRHWRWRVTQHHWGDDSMPGRTQWGFQS